MKDRVRILLLAAPSARRPMVEITVGADWSRGRQQWVRIERFIDRFRDWYSETVSDPESGEIIHSCQEPLSNHIGHGSAKVPLPDCLSDSSAIPLFDNQR